MEQIAKEVSLNPIKQGIRDGKLKEIANVLPFQGYPCNYGAISQVNPSLISSHFERHLRTHINDG
ncbi:hypothetical protein ASPACDRAFT_116760 [Aspergillus aculeatus ATCC 16872]|uniref:Uncharacterized protein n=1 Tax=Aspergillus aculeatus (strain ATCC 16872 / CBS 172.66 / WB 5094) TaxID=690307 RepID=A0A1L9X086_ASPA1|nr:uncharacterized protein ASPACDRAFT_116760 [Aspergillus aculeatus ATCC 16872]OJK01794.1 hypothetical protein ASPACDRAFT_116760 [Aspergillus aculeatus ATCC 16872]